MTNESVHVKLQLDSMPCFGQPKKYVKLLQTDDQPRHHQCPQGEDSWCFYQKALAEGSDPPSHSDHPASTYLASDVSVRLIPAYRRMSEDALLNRMRHGRTQNVND